jgi:hypothetical protein
MVMAMVLMVVATEVGVVCGCWHANHLHLTSPTHNGKRPRRHSHVSVTHSWHACSCVGLTNPSIPRVCCSC